MTASPKQSAILAFCRAHDGKITLDEATKLVGRNIYHNASKHTGALLSNMVKRAMLVREGRGRFRIAALGEGANIVRVACDVLPSMREWAKQHGAG